ncbi:MAG: hypothetical protein AAGJ79_05330 [Verrucomicrobiota bacterium]
MAYISPVLEELATPRMEVTGEYLRVVSCGAGMAMVAWSVRSGEFLELRCRCDGDGTLRIFPLEGRSGATLVQLEPANSQWEYTVGTGGQAFRALLSPQRVSLSGIDPLLPSIDPFARQ